MISFLYPLLWLGLAAAAVPIWLHLRRKPQTNILRFSTLRFLDDSPQPKQQPRKLQNLPLLLLRLLGLLLLIAAFTWPYLRSSQAIVIVESRVYLLDNTLSRQVDDAFSKDRERLRQEIRQLGPDYQVAVIELTSQPRLAVSFSDDRPTADQKLSQLQPSYERGSYLAAFRQAKSALDHSLGSRKRLVALTDNQENQWNENLHTPPFLDQIEVDLNETSVTNLPNLALAEPTLQRVFLGDRSLVNFSVKVSHPGLPGDINVVLQANNNTIFNRQINLTNQPQTILLTAQWEADPNTWLQGKVSASGPPDPLPQDNSVFFSLPPVREGHIALLAQSEYLQLALSPDVMRGHWATRQIDPTRIDQETDPDKDADVLVIEASYLQSPAARSLLWRYLTNRRGALVLINHLTPAVSGALRELGFEPQSRRPNAPQGRFSYVFSNHPIFHPFRSPDYGNLLEVTANNTCQIKPTDGVPLIFSDLGDGLFFQGTKFPGKLYVMAFGLQRDQTSWPLHQSFIPFLDLCLQNARPEDDTPINYEPGQVSIISRPNNSTAQTAVLRNPDQTEITRATFANNQARLTLPGQPGLYSVTFDQTTTPEFVLNVNPSPKESELVYLQDPAALKLWRMQPTQTVEPEPAPEPGTLSLGSILQQKLWWWLLLAGLALLLLESTLATPRKPTATA